MDDLDRMYRRLVQNLRGGFPDYLARPFEVAELYQTIIPYRHNRRELELETNQDYEMTLLRLLSGERGYMTGDTAMQDAMRRELSSPNPDLSAFRAWATTEVRLGDGEEPAAGDSATSSSPRVSVPADARPTAPLDAVPDAARTVPPNSMVAATSSAAPSSAGATLPPASASRPETSAASAPVAAAIAPPVAPPIAPRTAPPSTSPPLTLASTPAPSADLTPRSQAAYVTNGGSCRYCGGTLPDGRPITFCPHCGQNLTVRNCPACGTELEVGWRFCTTCGRDVGPTSL